MLLSRSINGDVPFLVHPVFDVQFPTDPLAPRPGALGVLSPSV